MNDTPCVYHGEPENQSWAMKFCSLCEVSKNSKPSGGPMTRVFVSERAEGEPSSAWKQTPISTAEEMCQERYPPPPNPWPISQP